MNNFLLLDNVQQVFKPLWFRITLTITLIVCFFALFTNVSDAALAQGKFFGGPVESLDEECKRYSGGKIGLELGDPRGERMMFAPNTYQYDFAGPPAVGKNQLGEVGIKAPCLVRRSKVIVPKYIVPVQKYRGQSASA